MLRYKNTEQLGLNATQVIVTEEIGWIYRHVPPPDLGIDAQIEQIIDYHPTARIIAVQIKSGLGNFHVGEKKITRYVSLVHYNYWISSNIPVIIVAHIPEWDKTLWEVVNDSTLKKTPSQWKIEISRFKEFNSKSIPTLNKLLEHDQKVPHDFSEKLERDSLRILETNKSLVAIIGYIHDMNLYAQEHIESIKNFVKNEMGLKGPIVKAEYTLFGNRLLQSGTLIDEEINKFAESFAASISAVTEIAKRHHNATNETSQLKVAYDMMIRSPSEMRTAIKTVKELKLTFGKYRDLGNPILKSGKAKFEYALDSIAREYSIALELTESVIFELEKILAINER